MSTQVVSHPGPRVTRAWPVWRVLGWTVVAFAAVFFFARTVPNYLHYDAAHYQYYWPKRWSLIAHIAGGSVALWTGLFQFSSRIRARYLQVHRWLGRLYLGGVLVGSLAAVYMGFFVSPLRAFGLSLEFLALAWVTTSVMAYVAVRRRQIAAHREWMIRSYVVTFGFVLFRLGEMAHVLASVGPTMQSVLLSWICWAVPLLLTDVALSWRRTMGAKKVPA